MVCRPGVNHPMPSVGENMTEETEAAVTVAYLHTNDVSYSWHRSMVELVGWDMANHGRIIRGGYIAMRTGTDGIVEARNTAIKEFLGEKNAEWLWWIDSDMGFYPDTIDRLVAAADPDERPIVGGLCFSQREVNPDGMGGWRCRITPTIFDWTTVDVYNEKTDGVKQLRAKIGEQQGFAVRWDYATNTVVRCSGTGAACVLIHRTALEKVGDKWGTWYARVPNMSTGQLISEDLSFCIRAGAIGIPIHVHTGVPTTHAKQVWLSEEDYWRQRAVDPPPVKVDEYNQKAAEAHA